MLFILWPEWKHKYWLLAKSCYFIFEGAEQLETEKIYLELFVKRGDNIYFTIHLIFNIGNEQQHSRSQCCLKIYSSGAQPFSLIDRMKGIGPISKLDPMWDCHPDWAPYYPGPTHLDSALHWPDCMCLDPASCKATLSELRAPHRSGNMADGEL